MNRTLWIAFSNSNGYFRLAATSDRLSSSPANTDGKPEIKQHKKHQHKLEIALGMLFLIKVLNISRITYNRKF